MNESEFDQFADEYEASLGAAVRLSGEASDYFAHQKVAEAAWLLNRMRQTPSVIVDFGAGVGSSLPHFERCFPNAEIICAEISTRSISVARDRFSGRADFRQITEGKLPVADASADLLFAACVFHHIPHAEHHDWLKQLHGAARPGARLFVFEHNPYNPLTRNIVNACPFDANAELISPGKLGKALEESGWQDVQCRYTLFFPALFAKLRVLEPWLSWLPLGAQYYATGVRR